MEDHQGPLPPEARRRGPGCGAVLVGLAAVLVLPMLLARFTSAPVALASFVVLLAGWLLVLYSVPSGALGFSFALETRKFPVEPEGDLVYCNGMPGSKVAEYLSEALKGSGARPEQAIQEDYGWGFYCEKEGCRIWVAVSYAGPADGSRVQPAEWVISTSHERGISPSQWARSARGMKIAEEVHALLRAAVRADPEVKMLPAGPT